MSFLFEPPPPPSSGRLILGDPVGGPSDVELAERFAALGGAVFPWKLIDGDKVPLVRWKDEAASHPVDIAMLAASYPERSGWGYVPPPGQVIVDLDIKRGHDGPAAWARENANRQEDPKPTIQWTTRSGGKAQLYRCDGHLPNTAGKLAPGLDTRGPDGWQSIPGSKDYHLDFWHEGELAPVPSWVPETIRASASPSLESGTDVELDRPHNVSRARDWLSRAEPAVSGEGGNDTTYRTAAVVRDMAVSAETCLQLMQETGGWNDRCDPPWDGDELARIVANAYQYAKHAPGCKALGDPHKTFEGVPAGGASTPQDNGGGHASAPALLNPFEAIQRPPPSWLVKDFIPQGGIGFLVGPSQSYKTFNALDACISVAAGADFHGSETAKGRAVYASTEGTQGLAIRMAACCEAKGLDFAEVCQDLRLIERLPTLSKPDDVQAFVDTLAPFKPSLVVLDHLAGMCAGLGMKEDETATVAAAAMLAISKALNCTVVTVHHANRGGTYYGSAFLEALVDFILNHKPDDNPNSLKVTVSIGKMKDASREPSFKLQGEVVEVQAGPGFATSAQTLAFKRTEDLSDRERVEQKRAAQRDLQGEAEQNKRETGRRREMVAAVHDHLEHLEATDQEALPMTVGSLAKAIKPVVGGEPAAITKSLRRLAAPGDLLARYVVEHGRPHAQGSPAVPMTLRLPPDPEPTTTAHQEAET